MFDPHLIFHIVAATGFEPVSLAYETNKETSPLNRKKRASRGNRTLVPSLEDWRNNHYTILAYVKLKYSPSIALTPIHEYPDYSDRPLKNREFPASGAPTQS